VSGSATRGVFPTLARSVTSAGTYSV
jgi:hypothetical protein